MPVTRRHSQAPLEIVRLSYSVKFNALVRSPMAG